MKPSIHTQAYQDSSQRSYTDPFDQLFEKKSHARYFRNTDNHSRKQSQASCKSLPLTCSSLSCYSESKHSRAESRLKEILAEIKNDSKEFSFDTRGEDPYEVVTQDDVPKLVWCAYCKAETKTYLVYTNNSDTLMNSVMICVFGGVFGCCLLPYCTNTCKDKKTKCSKCNRFVSENQ